MRSRHKPLESRHGRRVGDPLPPARRAAVQGSEGGLSPADFHSSSADDEAEGYGFYPTRFLISPSYDQLQSFAGSLAFLRPSFDFFEPPMPQARRSTLV